MTHGPLRILVIRFSSIGDIALTTPILRAIRERNPDCCIDYLTLDEYVPLLAHNPHIDRLIAFNRSASVADLVGRSRALAANRYAIVIDLHRSLRSLVVRMLCGAGRTRRLRKRYIKRLLLTRLGIDRYRPPHSIIHRYAAAAIGCEPPERPLPELYTTTDALADDITALARLLPELSISVAAAASGPILLCADSLRTANDLPIISLMPFAAWPTKEWGDDRCIELGRRLAAAAPLRIIIHGGEKDHARAKKIAQAIGPVARSIAGDTTIRQSMLLLCISQCLVTSDTGIMHLGTAARIPVISIFGCTSEQLGFFPPGNEQRVIQKIIPCRPCTAKGRRACPRRHFQCMNAISVEEVFAAAIEVIRS